MTAVVVPLSAMLLSVAGVGAMKFATFFVFKLAYGAVYTVIITPIILLRANADQRER